MHYADYSRGYVLKLEPGEELHETLLAFVEQKRIPSAFFQGIGALCNIELGFYNLKKQEYVKHFFEAHHELINASGNISIVGGKHFVHTHAVLANEQCQTISGHFLKGTVSVTIELFLFHVDIALNRKKDEKLNYLGLDLPHLFVKS